MSVETACYLSRRNVWVFLSDFVISFKFFFGFCADIFSVSMKSFKQGCQKCTVRVWRKLWRKCLNCIVRVWENFLRESFCFKKFFFSWIFSDPGRKNVTVLTHLIVEKTNSVSRDNLWRDKFFFQRKISFIAVFKVCLEKFALSKKNSLLVIILF